MIENTLTTELNIFFDDTLEGYKYFKYEAKNFFYTLIPRAVVVVDTEMKATSLKSILETKSPRKFDVNIIETSKNINLQINIAKSSRTYSKETLEEGFLECMVEVCKDREKEKQERLEQLLKENASLEEIKEVEEIDTTPKKQPEYIDFMKFLKDNPDVKEWRCHRYTGKRYNINYYDDKEKKRKKTSLHEITIVITKKQDFIVNDNQRNTRSDLINDYDETVNKSL